MTAAAKPSARVAKHHKTFERVYKPLLRYPTGRTEVIAQSGEHKQQGMTYPTRAAAVAAARHVMSTRHDDVLRRARLYRSQPGAVRRLQAEFELWGGEGSVLAAAAS